ncbi:MAG TPA: hypothetical protein VIU34_16095 [Steroidobacter sp.]
MPQIIIEQRTDLWMIEQNVHSSRHFVGKAASQPGHIELISKRSFIEFAFCVGMKLEFHPPSFALKR